MIGVICRARSRARGIFRVRMSLGKKENRGESALDLSCSSARVPRASYVANTVLFALLPVLANCSYIEKVRTITDTAVGVSQRATIETLVQANIERQRVRRARCFSPLITPATLSGAAVDQRLGSAWIDELLRDCPDFAAFLSELTFRRAVSAGILAPSAVPTVVGQTNALTATTDTP
ncbi:MAG: hypothetical protein IPK66_02785 [Rhodospirillales bacterium]|nr:hypothetical protein [Rhodospirillales bacterium]